MGVVDVDVQTVREAIEAGGSIRAAAKLLGKSYQSLQWWLARNGYRIEKRAVLVKAHPVKESK